MAIILPTGRPALRVVNGGFDMPVEGWPTLRADDPHVQRLIRATGRLDAPDNPAVPFLGSCFVVSPRLVLVARHSLGLADPPSMALNFDPGSTQPLVPVVAVRYQSSELDFAVLELAEAVDVEPLVLASAAPEPLTRDVAMVGFHARDVRNDQRRQDAIFGGVYNVKRLSPGRTLGLRPTQSFGGREVQALAHDACTLAGSTGGPLMDIATGRVLGLHFSGLYLKSNYAVPTWELARDPALRELGLHFDDAVPVATPTVLPSPPPDVQPPPRELPEWRYRDNGRELEIWEGTERVSAKQIASDPAEALQLLLLELFAEAELRIFVSRLPSVPPLQHFLPGATATLYELSASVVDVLQRRSLVDRALFDRLVAERPTRLPEIRVVARRCLLPA